MKPFTFLLIRLTIGMSMMGHGMVRIPKLSIFSEGMVANFEGSILPLVLVRPFSFALPFLELGIGVLLIFGLFTRIGAVLGGLLMVVLVFGTSMIENWGALPSQMIHILFFATVYEYIKSNSYAVDKLINPTNSKEI